MGKVSEEMIRGRISIFNDFLCDLRTSKLLDPFPTGTSTFLGVLVGRATDPPIWFSRSRSGILCTFSAENYLVHQEQSLPPLFLGEAICPEKERPPPPRHWRRAILAHLQVSSGDHPDRLDECYHRPSLLCETWILLNTDSAKNKYFLQDPIPAAII
ncbi:hypothetical protein CDAR_549051 [Caerostris darwini]|uniref:Uncharacterized protein n=1 Tax=Caerostris darwini TaxID=1538125 RepID=A0AAV4WJY1_9ARAC|nr:hypothetical protein CDAR_549051 [Caerostris darwini]